MLLALAGCGNSANGGSSAVKSADLSAFLEDVTNKVPHEHIRASGRDALATLSYTFAAMRSYEEGGALVVPEKLNPLHGDVKYVY